MATKEHFTDNVVPLSTRQVILERYDTDGDGKFDTNEIHSIIDDVVSMTQVIKSLDDTNSQMKKIIIGAFSLIVVLSISNFGTALLAMNMSKEVVVVDGKIMANGGSQEEAISTMTSVRTLKKQFLDTKHHQDRHRRILRQGNIFSQGVQGNDTPLTKDDNKEVICFTSNEVKDLLESTIDGSGTNIVLVGTAAENGSNSRTVIPINGEGHGLEGDEGGGYTFSNVQFVPVDSTERCTGETHRNLVNSGDNDAERNENYYKMMSINHEFDERRKLNVADLYQWGFRTVDNSADGFYPAFFDFGNPGTIKGFKISYASTTSRPHTVQIRLGDVETGELIATFSPVPKAGGSNDAYVGLLKDVGGVQDLTISFNWNDDIRFEGFELSDFADRTVVHAKIWASQMSTGEGVGLRVRDDVKLDHSQSSTWKHEFLMPLLHKSSDPHDRHFATYSQVNFGEPGTIEGIFLNYWWPRGVGRDSHSQVIIELRLGGPDGQVLATLLPSTRTQTQTDGFRTAYVGIEGEQVAGIHDLTILFAGTAGPAHHLRYFQLGRRQGILENIALMESATAWQSSNPYSNGLADAAIDGNTSGVWNEGSVSHTQFQNDPIWYVAWPEAYLINSIKVWNRIDVCGNVPCQDRLVGFVLTIYLKNQIMWSSDLSSHVDTSIGEDMYDFDDIPSSMFGDKVEVRIPGYAFLSLAEVQVFGFSNPSIYFFPPVASSQFVHGLCAMGASSFTATATDQNLTYEVGSENFQNGVTLWGNRDYVVNGVRGPDTCRLGIYLKPSRVKAIDENTEISVQFESIGERREVTICALIEEGEERSGNWHEELVSKGFVASERTLEFMTNIDTGYVVGYLRSYCRQI